MELSNEEVSRYSRHIMLPEVGASGQLRLKNAKVLLIGMGGLGSPVSLYLAAAGVGHLGLMDFDRVDISNLQRQILFVSDEVGQSKALCAKKRLSALNPNISIQVLDERLSLENALAVIKDFDVVVDGSDNFTTRYLVNDACFFLKKPLVYGSIFRFNGQATFFAFDDGPCYRCLFPKAPPEGLAPNCAEAGVIGVLPGMIGTIQANETIKWILKIGNSLNKRLLTLDALAMSFRTFSIEKNPDCPLCGEAPTILDLATEDFVCSSVQVPEVSADEFVAWRKKVKTFTLLDVREPEEYATANLGALLIPLAELSSRLKELDKEANILVHCASGKRSLKACLELKAAGFLHVWNLEGGMLKNPRLKQE